MNYLEGLSVKFTPFALSRFVNESISTLKNKVTAFLGILKDSGSGDNLTAQFFEASSMKEKIALIERFLIRSLCESSAVENRIFHLANQIKYNPSGDVIIQK